MYDTDWDLIQACRRGDNRAWDHILDRYGRLVYAIPLNYGLPLEDAADISQITFTILLQSLDNFDPNARLGGWLATVARRHTWRLMNRRRREPPAPLDLTQNLALPEEKRPLHRWEMIEWVESGLVALDERCRQLLLALYFEKSQPSYAEVAERFDMAVGSIGPTRARCLHRLKQLLQEEDAPSS